MLDEESVLQYRGVVMRILFLPYIGNQKWTTVPCPSFDLISQSPCSLEHRSLMFFSPNPLLNQCHNKKVV